MNAPTSAAAARKPLPVKSELEVEIGNLLTQKAKSFLRKSKMMANESGPLSRG